MKMWIVLVVLALQTWAQVASAEATSSDWSTNNPFIIRAYYGAANFSGSLSSESGAPMYGVSLAIIAGSIDRLGGLKGMIDFDLMTISTTNSSDKFPFSKDKTISVNPYTISFGACGLAKYPINICLGLGTSTLTVSDDKNEQRYGASDAAMLYIPYQIASDLTFGLEAKYFRVGQIVNDRASHFELVTYAGSLGWAFGRHE